MLLFELGMMFEAYSTDSAKRSIKELIDIRPEYATRKVHGKEFKVDPSALKLGHIIVIKPGERIPVDAVVVSGTTSIDTKLSLIHISHSEDSLEAGHSARPTRSLKNMG